MQQNTMTALVSNHRALKQPFSQIILTKYVVSIPLSISRVVHGQLLHGLCKVLYPSV